MLLSFFDRLENKHPKTIQLAILGVLFLDQILKKIFYEKGSAEKNFGSLFSIDINPYCSFFALLLLVIFYFFRKNKNYRKATTPSALIVAGILSNSIDRMRLGFVIDYINLFNIFVFNLADIMILCGAIILFWQIVKE